MIELLKRYQASKNKNQNDSIMNSNFNDPYCEYGSDSDVFFNQFQERLYLEL